MPKPGRHEAWVVGIVTQRGAGAQRFELGQRVGVPGLGGTDGRCRFCRRGDENLCVAPIFTGWDVDGGYADECLGIYRFGGSAHLTAQLALHLGLRVHVLTRGEANRALATALGVDSVGGSDAAPPNRWTAPPCSRRLASWSRWRWPRWTGAGRWPRDRDLRPCLDLPARRRL